MANTASKIYNYVSHANIMAKIELNYQSYTNSFYLATSLATSSKNPSKKFRSIGLVTIELIARGVFLPEAGGKSPIIPSFGLDRPLLIKISVPRGGI